MDEKKDVEVLSEFDDLLEDDSTVAFEEQTSPTAVEASTNIFGIEEPMAENPSVEPVSTVEPVSYEEPVIPTVPTEPVLESINPIAPEFTTQNMELPMEPGMPETPIVEASVAPSDVVGAVDEATVIAQNGEEMNGLQEHPSAQIDMSLGGEEVNEEEVESLKMEKGTKKNLIFIGILGGILLLVILLLPLFIK